MRIIFGAVAALALTACQPRFSLPEPIQVRFEPVVVESPEPVRPTSDEVPCITESCGESDKPSLGGDPSRP